VTIAEDADTKFITGHYTAPAERVWLQAVARAGGLLLFTGPPATEPDSTGATHPCRLSAQPRVPVRPAWQ
jgi:hypothetical protein